MNFLAHHVVARALAPDEPPLFYAGNLTPDWLGIAGEGTLRRKHVEGKPGPLAAGARLHLSADAAFHSDPIFAQLCAEANALLRPLPLTRVFFYAHVAVELAMDATLLRQQAEHADDLFAQISLCQPRIAPDTAHLLERAALPGLEGVTARFVKYRWILAYASDEGLATRLCEVGERVGLGTLEVSQRPALTAACTALRALVAPETAGLLLRAGAGKLPWKQKQI